MENNHDSCASAKPRRWRTWLKAIGGFVLLAGVLAAIVGYWNRDKVARKIQEIRAQRNRQEMLANIPLYEENLAKALAQLDRNEPGWRFEELEAAREKVLEEENSALVVRAAARLLPKDWPPKEFDSQISLLTPQEQLTPAAFALLQQELDKVRPARNEARKLADLPRGRYAHKDDAKKNSVAFAVAADAGFSTHIALLLVYEAALQNQNGESNHALVSCRAALNAARALGDEPSYFTQMYRIIGILMACQTIERTLAQGEPAPDGLAALQRAVAVEDEFPGLIIAARGERARLHAEFTTFESGHMVLPNREEKPVGPALRAKFLKDHPAMLAALSRYVAIARLPLHEQAGAEQVLELELRKCPATMFTAYLSPYAKQVFNLSRRNHALLRCTIAALAAERYRQKNKDWPQKLDTLCPQFLKVVPLDPFDGKPLRYRRAEDGVIIYSVNNDRFDNHGNLDRLIMKPPGLSMGVSDLGIRLWDVPKRRQPPGGKAQKAEGSR